MVEMGAAWCKPCAAAIPELTRLSKKYSEKVIVTGAFVQEINYELPDVPHPKYIDRVKKYVKQQGEKVQYHIAVDDPQKTIEKSWTDTFGQGRGVPQIFVINKEKRIASHFSGLNIEKLEKTIAAILDESLLNHLLTAQE